MVFKVKNADGSTTDLVLRGRFIGNDDVGAKIYEQLTQRFDEPPPPPPPPPDIVMLMGCSDSSNDHGGTEVWDGWRTYSESPMLALANRTSTQRPKFLAYSKAGDNLGGANPTYTSVYNEVLADLNTFYYTGGPTSQVHTARWGISLYWSNGNENQDKGALGPSGRTAPGSANNVAGFVESQRGLYDACHFVDQTTGLRRFPDAYAGSNPTHDAEFSGIIQEYLHPSARYHDFVMWSMYPPGRKITGPDPTYNYPSFNEADRTNRPLGYLLRGFYRTSEAQKYARANGSPQTSLMVSVGEIGIGDDPGDNTTRPYYAVHGLAEGLLRLSEKYNLKVPFACWWDNQSGVPENVLSDEDPATNPSTRVAWQNHLQYNRFRGGTLPGAWTSNPKTSGGQAWKTTGNPI